MFYQQDNTFNERLNSYCVLSCVDSSIGTESKMKLWDVMATCLLLLSSVSTRPLYQNLPSAQRAHPRDHYIESLSMSVEEPEMESLSLQEISMEEQCKYHRPGLRFPISMDRSNYRAKKRNHRYFLRAFPKHARKV